MLSRLMRLLRRKPVESVIVEAVGETKDYRPYYGARHRDRAFMAVATLKRIGRYEPDMEARELTEEEVFAGILLGTVEVDL